MTGFFHLPQSFVSIWTQIRLMQTWQKTGSSHLQISSSLQLGSLYIMVLVTEAINNLLISPAHWGETLHLSKLFFSGAQPRIRWYSLGKDMTPSSIGFSWNCQGLSDSSEWEHSSMPSHHACRCHVQATLHPEGWQSPVPTVPGQH